MIDYISPAPRAYRFSTTFYMTFALLLGTATTISPYSLAASAFSIEERFDWPIEFYAPETATFKNVHLYQENDTSIYITGRVSRKLKSGSQGGYVLLSIVSGNTVYYDKRSSYLRLGHIHRRLQGTNFRIDIPLVPIKGSRILLQYYINQQKPGENN